MKVWFVEEFDENNHCPWNYYLQLIMIHLPLEDGQIR